MGNIVLGYKRFVCRVVENNRTLAVCVIDPLFKLFLLMGIPVGLLGKQRYIISTCCVGMCGRKLFSAVQGI